MVWRENWLTIMADVAGEVEPTPPGGGDEMLRPPPPLHHQVSSKMPAGKEEEPPLSSTPSSPPPRAAGLRGAVKPPAESAQELEDASLRALCWWVHGATSNKKARKWKVTRELHEVMKRGSPAAEVYMYERHGAAPLSSAAKEDVMDDVQLLLAECGGGDPDSTALALAWVATGLGKVVAAGASALKGMLLLWYELCVFGEEVAGVHDHARKDRARLTAMLAVVCACERRAVPRADDDGSDAAAAEAAVCGAFAAMCGLLA